MKKQSHTTVPLRKSGKGESYLLLYHYLSARNVHLIFIYLFIYHKLGTMNKKTVPAEVQDQNSENSTQARQGAEHCGHIAKTENK